MPGYRHIGHRRPAPAPAPSAPQPLPQRPEPSWDHAEALRLARLSAETLPQRRRRRFRAIRGPLLMLGILAAGYILPSAILGGVPF